MSSRGEEIDLLAMSPRTTLPRATDALVDSDDPPDTLARIAREKHTLLERHAFERVGTTTSLTTSRGLDSSRDESPSSSNASSSSFAVRPPVMHFGGFELGKAHTQTFVVTNTGVKSKRLVVIEPTTEHFKVLPRNKVTKDAKTRGGKLAPGVSETITVVFTPKDGVRYYYDCVRVHAEGAEGLVLPVHAYPVMNEVAFPKVVDFGLRAVGETHEKTVTMTCTAPIAFEYELICRKDAEGKQQKTDSRFSVTPASGIVPAEGCATIALAFTPSVAATATLELEVRVAQFGFRPFVCQVRGTGFPANAIDTKNAGKNTRTPLNPAPRPAPPAKPKPRLPSRRSGGDDATFRADAVVAAFELRAAGYAKADAEAIVKHSLPHSELGPRGRKLSARAVLDAPRDVSSPETADGEEKDAFDTNGYVSDASEDLVDGVFVPRKLRGASDFARVLSQKHGKLRAKDIEKAMAARDARVSAAATLRKSVATAAGAIAKMKASAAAAAFRKLLAAAGAARAKENAEDPAAEDPHPRDDDDQEEAARDVNSRPNAVEEEDAREVGGVAALRGLFAAATFRSRSEDETMAALDDPELEPEVKAHLFEREFDRVRRFEKSKEWTECVAVGEAKRTAEEEKAATRRRRAREASLRYVEASTAMARLAAGEPAAFGARYDVSSSSDRGKDDENENASSTFEPTFNPLSADDWPKRREALDRFAQAGRRVIVRNRAEKRLRGVRRLLRAAKGNAGSLDGAAAFVARDVMTFTDTNEGHLEVLEQTLDPKRRAFFRARAEETREARLGVARTDALAEPPEGSFASERKRPPLFPVFRASAFARRSAIGTDEMARSAIQPWEEICFMKPIAQTTWRARGYDSSELSAEGAFPKLEGDGAPPPDSALPFASAGAQEEEHTGVGVPARMATDDASSKEFEASPRLWLRAATAVAETVAPDAKRAWEPSLHPARFPPWINSFATPGPASRDRDASLLPATYGHDDSLASEPAGMNAAERAASENRESLFVAERFAPRENTNQTASLYAVDPWMAEWMAGPDPRDTAEAEGEGETPAAAPAPTLESVAEEVAKALGSDRTAGDAGTGTGTRPEIGVVPGGVAARALVEREVDAAVASSRAERMRRVEARAAEIDAAVDDPRLRWRLEG